MTRCKLHPYEPGAGVCASCLRDRLFALLAVHPELSAGHHHPADLFPRSADSAASQLGATFADAARPRRRDRFPLLRSLFGNPRSGEAEADPRTSKSSWLSSLLRGRGRRRKPPAAVAARACRPSHRGLSPAVDEPSDESISYSGYSTDSSSGGRRLPASTPMRRLPAHQYRRRYRGISGFTVCLSPLRRWPAPDAAFSGELRRHHHHDRDASIGAASLSLNRSCKLADFGRFR